MEICAAVFFIFSLSGYQFEKVEFQDTEIVQEVVYN